MTAQELKAKGAVYFEHIVDGMRHYENRIVRLNSCQARDKFMELWEKNGYQDVYVDFYYFGLPREAKNKLEQVLSPQERTYIHKMEPKDGEVIFPADEMLFSICAKLNDSGMLFSTVYVTGRQKSTWWGNYGSEYVVFTEKEGDSATC